MKKLISWLGVITVLFSLFSIVGTAQVFADESTAAQGKTIVTGTVSAVDGDKITVTDDSGNETTFTVSYSTEYAIEMDSGNTFGGVSTPPEMPNGNGQQEGTPPEKPSGDMQQGSNPPEMPSGNGQMFGEGNIPPEMPNGNGQQGGTPPEKPSGDMGQDETPPEKSDGDIQQGGTPPEKPDGDMQQSGDPKSMLTVGTTVTVTLADDGTAAKIQIEMNGNPEGGFGGGFGGGFSGNGNITYEAV